MDQLEIRTCMECKEPTLVPISREMQIYNSVIHYKCETCDGKIEIQPLASIGVLIAVGASALAFWGYITFRRAYSADIISVSIYSVAVLAFLFVTVTPLLAHIMNPVVKKVDGELPNLESNSKHLAGKQIVWLEGFGILGGLIAPFIFAIIVLGIAFIIGYINYTFFE
ncbi:hypothetical protein [Lentilitoribacter sp. Alg239-R112]|uniref:hypothetical protein n=1 Tax=Lentilitoribacter sp. Alg239-R112 TaxID=2305987 RepID=UPI0013A69B41|nr:hypothetical protein [Lentilitoribacter sp. Alg239-R112]